MVKPDVFEIVSDIPDKRFYPGQYFKGVVNLEISEELKLKGIFLELLGQANVKWTEVRSYGQHTQVIVYYNKEKYFDEKILLNGSGNDEFVLQPGKYSYPFQYKLSENLPSSFESCHGKVRYSARCVIDRPCASNVSTKIPFSVLSVLDLNNVPNVKERSQAEKSKMLCCLCCKAGPIEGIIRLERSAYVPGDKVVFNAEISNLSNRKMAGSMIELVQNTTCISSNPCRKQKTDRKKVLVLKHGEIPGKGSDVWINESFIIPPLPPSGLNGCSIINVEYTVQLVVDPAGPSLDLHVPAKVVLGNIPLREDFDRFASMASKRTDTAIPLAPSYDSALGLAPLNATAAPQTNQYQEYEGFPVNMPRPLYQQSVFGATNFEQDEDDQHTMGQMDFAPVYLSYNYDNHAFQTPPE